MQISNLYLQFEECVGIGKLCSSSGFGAPEIRAIGQELGRIIYLALHGFWSIIFLNPSTKGGYHEQKTHCNFGRHSYLRV